MRGGSAGEGDRGPLGPVTRVRRRFRRGKHVAWRRGRRAWHAVAEVTGIRRLRILTRYVLRRFLKIWGLCVLGVPFLFIVIDLVDNLDTYLAQGASRVDVFWHYVFSFPYQVLLAFPIACLLAAVFTVARMTRHFEITAAKAGGISFHRLVAPLLVLSLGISLVALGLTEVVPHANERSEEVLGTERTVGSSARRNFVFRSEGGRVYAVNRLAVDEGKMTDVQVTREGGGWEYPTYHLWADSALWDAERGGWTLKEGRIRLFPAAGDSLREEAIAFRFASAWQRDLRESPEQLLADPKDPKEMDYGELGRFIEAIERSGGDAADLRVERALKISFPFTCFIIVLFGAPLANTSRQGGPALSIGIALAITILFMVLIRVSQALGAGGMISPTLAAWLPNGLFLVMAAGLWSRLRT